MRPEDAGHAGEGQGQKRPSPEHNSDAPLDMLSEAQVTVRNIGLLLLQRGSHVLNVFLFAALLPRLMGPTTFGQYSLLSSLVVLIVFGGSLGITQIMGRYVPEFMHRGDREGLLKLVGQLAVTRVGVAAAGATLYFTITFLWLRDLDWVVLGFMALSVFFYMLGNFVFVLFLGLNKAALWGMNETLRRWASLVFMVAGFTLWGLKGLCLGLVLTELLVFSIGCWWARSYLSGRHFRVEVDYLTPLFRIGLIFFASEIILAAFQFSGTGMIWLVKEDYAQVSYFGLAYQGYILAAVALGQLALAFAPFLTGLMVRRDTQGLKQALEQLLKWLGVSSVLVFLGALFLADSLVPFVMGDAFRPVSTNLVILILALLFHGGVSVGVVLTIIGDRPGVALGAAALRLTVFLLAGVPLVTLWGSLGACLAISLAGMVSCGYYLKRTQEVVSYSLRSWCLTLGLGVVFTPLAWLKSSWEINLGLGCAAVAGYAGMLLLLKFITFGELAALWRALVSRSAVVPQTLGEN